MIPAPSVLNYSNKLSHGTFGGPGFSVTTGLKGELALPLVLVLPRIPRQLDSFNKGSR
jgi:hypothetical protein